MSVDVQAEPHVEPSTTDDDDLIHIFCCDENKALCGASLPEGEWADPDLLEPEDCVVCRDLEPGTCGALFCRLRGKWRWSRWGRLGRWTPP